VSDNFLHLEKKLGITSKRNNEIVSRMRTSIPSELSFKFLVDVSLSFCLGSPQWGPPDGDPKRLQITRPF